MGRELVMGFVFLGLIVYSLLVHYLIYSTAKEQNLQTLSRLTTFSSPSLSVAFYEPRLPLGNSMHPSYPSMPSLNKRDFIYAK